MSDHPRRALTRTVFADAEGVAAELAQLLGDANVTIAESFESAIASDSEVLVLYLGGRSPDRLSAETVASLRTRKLVVMGAHASSLCIELELVIGGGNVIPAEPLRVLGGRLLGDGASADSIEPYAAPSSSLDDRGFPAQRLSFRTIPEELRLRATTGFVDVIADLTNHAEDEAAVVAREANCVFAGVDGPPASWSDAYRRLFGQVVSALAGRELEAYRPAVVTKPVHPPGTVQFDLAASAGFWSNRESNRQFYLRFDRPTVLTATLRHHGSGEVAFGFSGGPKQRHWTRQDARHGETLTIAVTVGQAAIDAMAGRYWNLWVSNFDLERGLSATLNVRYDALDGGKIRPLPSNASFEHFHWFAESLPTGDPATRRSATAEAFGFDDWPTLQRHVAWSPLLPPEDLARARDIYHFRARQKHGEAFGLAPLFEDFATHTQLSDELRHAVEEAFASATSEKHATVGVEHLLMALLDNAVAADVLAKCGADVELLRSGLQERLRAVPHGPEPFGSRELYGVLCGADAYSALGRETGSVAGVLVAVFAERSQAYGLLAQQGVHWRDVLRYLAHGIPKVLPRPHVSSGVVGELVEASLHGAFERAAASRHEAFGVEHVLLALAPALASTERQGIRDEVDGFLATMPTVADGPPQPTRALNRVMQQAVARAQRKGTAADTDAVIRAMATETGTFAADVLSRYDVISG